MEMPQESCSAETEFLIKFFHKVSNLHKSAMQEVDNKEHYYEYSEGSHFLINNIWLLFAPFP